MRWRAADEYVCVRLGGQSYLLPYGQKIADFHVGLQINESGILIWNALKDGAGEEELLELLCRRFEAQGEDIPRIRRDLEEFLGKLAAKGVIGQERSGGVFQGTARPYYFHAGSLRVRYDGPETVCQKYFAGFGCGEGEADQRVEILPFRPPATLNGRVLVRGGEFILMEGEESYIMLLPVFPDIYELHVSKDGRLCRIYCRPEMSGEEQEHIFHAMRFAFLVLAQNRGLCVVHSASLLYRERAWLFSGKSGTGKSTHTNLWRDAWGITLLNGDLNCLGIEEGRVWSYGLPWCGTSGIASSGAHLLGGVVFLRQGKENRVQELTEAEKACLLAMRMITPTWTAEMLNRNLALSERIIRGCMAARLCCTREQEAAQVMRRYIDEYCGGEQGNSGGRGNKGHGSGQN